jgi:deoxyribodipyrimidine photo-lyase
MSTAIVWFRQDLRLADNPALAAALAAADRVVPVFILDDEAADDWAMGGASRWWLHHSLAALGEDLAARGSRLLLRRGPADLALAGLIAETGAAAIYVNRLYEPWAVRRDSHIKAALETDGRRFHAFHGALLFEPSAIRTQSGKGFRVFTPFWKACLAAAAPSAPLSAPALLPPGPALAGDDLDDWGLLPRKPDWAGGLRAAWRPGEAGAQLRLDAFCQQALRGYAERRDFPERAGTSMLSPHLHWGEIAPRQIWRALLSQHNFAQAQPYLRQLGWREFCHHLLRSVPSLPEAPIDDRFAEFPWVESAPALAAWRQGRTGYPIVDAGMRQLWLTGWMHNRVRMVVASFLTKHLLQPWQAGERWFWDTLVDADLANNAAGWQWVAGCGADAAPYFRIFNPVLQGEKFDPDGAYVRRYVPELAKLPASVIHKPWETPDLLLHSAGVRLGLDYPRPIVDHAEARARALEAYRSSRSVEG